MKHSARFTLIEIAIAIAVFAIGILTAMAILVPSVRWGADAKTDFTAAEAALNLMQKANNTGVIDNPYLGPGHGDGGQGREFYPYAARFFPINLPETNPPTYSTDPMAVGIQQDVDAGIQDVDTAWTDANGNPQKKRGIIRVYRKLPANPFDGAGALAKYSSDIAPQVIFEMNVNLLYQ